MEPIIPLAWGPCGGLAGSNIGIAGWFQKYGYFLEPQHSIMEWDSWVDFPLARLESKDIGYFLEYDHTIDEQVDLTLTGLDSSDIGYFLESNHTISVVPGFD